MVSKRVIFTTQIYHVTPAMNRNRLREPDRFWAATPGAFKVRPNIWETAANFPTTPQMFGNPRENFPRANKRVCKLLTPKNLKDLHHFEGCIFVSSGIRRPEPTGRGYPSLPWRFELGVLMPRRIPSPVSSGCPRVFIPNMPVSAPPILSAPSF